MTKNFHAKVIMSEYIPLGHPAAQAARGQPAGWRYRTAPPWVYQGLQEYDGIFHTTDFNRSVVGRRLREFGKANSTAFTCCQDGLAQISDVYNGGRCSWRISPTVSEKTSTAACCGA